MIQLAAIAGLMGPLTLVVLTVACVILWRRFHALSTGCIAAGISLCWLGSLVQILAPTGDILVQDDELLGTVGAFSDTWYFGSVIFQAGMFIAAIGALWFSIEVTRRS